jgi:hypothetical protein
VTVPNRPVSGAPIETAWGDVVHDSIVALDVQSGIVSVAIPVAAANGGTDITFARPFAAPPAVLATLNTGVTSHFAFVLNITAAGCRVALQNKDAGTSILAATPVGWLAIGPRA